jgi:8-oxo-dGTP pyrophosphatase MutT (NUDIX family)
MTGMPRKPPARAPKTPPRTRFEVSAGGVIYRRSAEGFDVALIATKGGTRWQLPKGKQEKGETLETTAAREVAEETGLVGEVEARLEAIDIWFSATENGHTIRSHKLIHFYLLAYRDGDTADHDDEVDDACWFPIEEAIERLTFPSERRVVERAQALLENQPVRAGVKS